MLLKRVLPVLVIILSGLGAFCGYWTSCIGEIDRTYQNGWQNVFVVKVERRVEMCGFVRGAYYAFSSRQEPDGVWREVMRFRHDDPTELGERNIQIVNDRIAIIHIGWKAAVTSDAGKTWNLWNAETNLPNWVGANYGLIEKIEISENGKGVMLLDPIPNRNEPKELVTADFGKTWIQSK